MHLTQKKHAKPNHPKTELRIKLWANLLSFTTKALQSKFTSNVLSMKLAVMRIFTHKTRKQHCANLYVMDLQHGEELVEASTQHGDG